VSALAVLHVGSGLSYVVAVIIPALDAIFPVLPSETVIIALGVATAGSADPRIALLVACAAAGAFLGDNLAYLLGRRFGPRVERRFFGGEKGARRRAWAERSLQQYGMPLIVVCRFIPGGRTAVMLCCGIIGYQRRRFVIATAAAGLIWAAYSFFIGRLVLHRAAGRPRLRGQALGRVAAGVRRHDRRQRADRVDPADQVLQSTWPGRHGGVTPDRLRPMTPARTRPIDTSFRVDTASPRKIMPTVAAPTAPIPVHAAYAAPTSSSRSATVSSAKLISAHMAKVTVGHSRVIPWLCFSATAKPVSNSPAVRIVNHAIASPICRGAPVISCS
jgi:membrane-associated protein